MVIWHVLQDPNAQFQDLGADYVSSCTNPHASKHSHIRQLEALG